MADANSSGSRNRSRTYRTWESMRHRCQNPNHSGYFKYGAIGVKVCDRWQVFANFLADMGERPDGMTLDRIDGSGNYEPANCRWASATTQATNRRSTRFITHQGVTRSMREWALVVAMPYKTLAYRLSSGWIFEDAISLPLGSKNPRVKVTQSLEARARRMGRGKGVPLSEEHKRKLSESHKGLKQSEETRRKKSDYWTGKPWTEARRAAHEASKLRKIRTD